MSVEAIEKPKAKMAKDVFDLLVFNRAYELSIAIHKASLEFPKIEQYALANQLRRASKSICANIAEGFGKQSYSSAEFSRFLGIAEGSVTEVHVWLKFAFDLGYITKSQFEVWVDDCMAIKAMLYKLRVSL